MSQHSRRTDAARKVLDSRTADPNHDRHMESLARLAKAADTAVLQRIHRKYLECKELSSVWDKHQQEVLDAFSCCKLMQLMFAAATNSMDVAMKETEGSELLLQPSVLDVVCSLLSEARRMLLVYNERKQQPAYSGLLLAETDFLKTLSSFTSQALDSLQSLADTAAAAATTSQNLHQAVDQQQQSPTTANHAQQSAACLMATTLFRMLLKLWRTLVSSCTDALRKQTSPGQTVAVAVRLAATAVPLWSKLHQSNVAGSKEAGAPPALQTFFSYSSTMKDLSSSAISWSSLLSALIGQFYVDCKDAAQQQRKYEPVEHVFSSDHIYHVLLLSIIHHTLAIQAVAADQTPSATAVASSTAAAAAVSNTQAAAAAAADAQTQLSNQRQQKQQRQRILDSHNECLRRLGFYSDWKPADNFSKLFVHVGDCCFPGLAMMRYLLLILGRFKEVRSNPRRRQRWLQQPAENIHLHDPSYLFQPTIKLVLEFVLLLPPTSIKPLADSIEVILLLLSLPVARSSSSSSSSSSTAAAADGSSTVGHQSSEFRTPWPVLPAAVAAGLLHPVAQLLSHIVVRALRETEPQQQQQQQTRSSDYTTLQCDRQRLLQHYGNLLVTVCQAVAPKHIAAALRSDPVIPLVAIEAVIRHQAHHIMPSSSYQQQQQQQYESALLTDTDLPPVSTDTSSHRGHAAVLLLPFVSKVVHALHQLVQNDQLLQLLDETPQATDGAQFVDNSAVRLFSISTTACKVVQAAASCIAQQDPPTVAAAATGLPLPMGMYAEPAAASSTESAVAPSLSYSDLLGIPYAVLQLAQSWEQLLFDHCNDFGFFHSIQHNILPIALLMQALKALGTALTCSHWVVEHGATSAARSQLAAVRPSASAAVTDDQLLDNMVAGAVARQLATIEDSLHDAYHTYDSSSLWGAVQVMLDRTGYDASVQRHQQWLQLLIDDDSAIRRFKEVLQFSSTEYLRCLSWSVAHTSGERVTVLGAVNPVTGETEFDWGVVRTFNDNTGAGPREPSSVHSATVDWRAQVQQLYQMLQDTAGHVGAELLVPFCCNNPSCINLSKLSEYQLVSGKACVCGGCKVARYCSRECQKKHWKQHKQVCRLLKLKQSRYSERDQNHFRLHWVSFLGCQRC